MFSIQNLIILRLNYRNIKTKWTCIACIRSKSSAEPKTKTYSHTILFPATKFPARSSNAVKEEIQKTAQFSELYSWQREHLSGPEFVLHDGPPYANGDLHMGHAVNKIIKDINNRSQVLQGNKVHYVPGWDCHGLPIELKALQKAKKSSKCDISYPVEIRNIARKFALETVAKQKAAFESWGVMADWERQSYLTLDKSYIKKQLHQFYTMYKSGLIYRALKPVYWSPSSKTALAEAELEYNPQYKSKEVYVTFPIQNIPQDIQDMIPGKSLSAVIWTTTPWTLVANRAVCYSPKMQYSVVTFGARPGHFVVASGLVEALERTLGMEIRKVVEFEGSRLFGATYYNKLTGSTLPFLAGDHVTDDKGTGLVHTAPAHGPDDFLVALKNNMTVDCNVDESGCYTNLDPELNGLPVLKEGQDVVIGRLSDSIVHQGVYVHSYPLDWRTKKPVILRASQQWFIDTAALKDQALKALESVEILPPSSAEQSRQGFRAQLEKRPYWCISRQRAWGVPIPVLYRGEDAIVDERIIDKLCSLIETQGADAWWTCDVKKLLPYDVVVDYDLENQEVTKGKDIMDIWLDSGVSWQTLCGKQARLYSEGVDQLTGWFQAALLTSLAITREPPYQSIFVHGFVVDDKKRKMSKSIGNVIDPYTIINGGKDKNNQPAYGIDTLRWWVASHATQHAQIIISKKLLDDCQAEVIRVRNILKYLLGVISDLQKSDFTQNPELNYFDAYMVHESRQFLSQIEDCYNNFRYNHVAQNALYFISNKVSALYCHCVKDRLYCSAKNSVERLSAQLVVHTLLVSLCKALGPILPHLIEEVWQHHPMYEKPFYFTPELPFLSAKVDTKIMDTVLDIKRDICVLAKNENLKKFTANIELDSELYEEINTLNFQDGVNDSWLTEVLELSSVKLNVKIGGKWEIKLNESDRNQCLRCRKYNVEENSDKCLRCEKVVECL
ncbi:isoleucine--tRNA ligase, mitochondrial [Pectinophora gossypiella]|uniref:isoleucine--tRNA ligase, mitochondrial n=1 Tax=Pectinophora gossypiella TaxID=13191 RepID=UPI00214E414D|nr:isoleucine--tRNA ligase, mitochondrial [Pectinophora gossypiella]